MPEPFVKTTSRVMAIPRANIDTDQICPARFLKITDKAGLADALFFDWRFNSDGTRRQPPSFIDEPHNSGRQFLLVGDNFGAGSSREHAPWALRAWGIRAIFSTGFADIFRGNALKNALLPIVVSPERYAALTALQATNADGAWTVDLEAQKVTLPGGEAPAGEAPAGEAPAGEAPAGEAPAGEAPAGESFAFEIDPFARKMILAGTDEVGYVLTNLTAIEAWEAAHPARVDTARGAAR
jgi:3-isopropylmalate/(R)-2-methylmalate dehydratase small subunit